MAITDRIAGLTGNVAIKAPCAAATTAAITLSGLQTIDGVALTAGDRVLVKNQADTTTNGIYVAGSGTWERASDFNGVRDVVSGTLVFVRSGTTNGNQIWKATATDPVTVGDDAVTFSYAVTFAGVSISAFVQTLLDDADAAAFLTTLGVSSYIQTLLNDADAATARTTLGITGATVAWADVASATTTDLGAEPSESIRITGTTTITGFGTVASGTFKSLRFAAALTLTHNATSLILPGGANITTAANDTALARSLGAGNWIVLAYSKASGKPNALIGVTDLSASGTPSSTTFLRGDNSFATPTAGFTSGTPTAPSAVASVTVTGIPSTAKLIYVTIQTLTCALGSPSAYLQLGDSGGLESSGYSGDTYSAGTGHLIGTITSSSNAQVVIAIVLQDAATNTWLIQSTASTTTSLTSTTVKSTSATMDRIGILTSASTLSATKINILYA